MNDHTDIEPEHIPRRIKNLEFGTPPTIIVAHQGESMRRAYPNWRKARAWRDAVDNEYILTEVILKW